MAASPVRAAGAGWLVLTETPLLRPANRPITLRQLLTHSAGHGYTIWDASLKQFRKLQPQARPIPGDNAVMSQPLVADPGER